MRRSRIEFGGIRLLQAANVARKLDHHGLHAQADAEIRDLILAGVANSVQHAIDAALAETAGHQDAVVAFQLPFPVGPVHALGLDSVDAHLELMRQAPMQQGLFQAFVGILVLDVFAHQTDGRSDSASLAPHGPSRRCLGRGWYTGGVAHELQRMDRRQFTWNPRSGESYPTEALMADSRTANGETASMTRTRRSLSTSASLASMPAISETLVLLEVGHSNRESTLAQGTGSTSARTATRSYCYAAATNQPRTRT